MDVLRKLAIMFDPLWVALFTPRIPFTLRWRLIPLNIVLGLGMPIQFLPWTFSRAYTVHMIPNRNGTKLRCLVFQPQKPRTDNKLRPLHLSLHSGAFVGGIAETCAQFASEVCNRTGAVVVCSTYRFAPKHPYPAAHNDTDDVVAYLLANAERLWQANPELLTTSGLSAGGTLAVAAAQQPVTKPGAKTSIKASVTFYAPLDFRLKPIEKPKSGNFPKKDPLAVLLPLYDSYPGPVRENNMTNPHMSPCIANIDMVPENMLFIIPEIDIVVHEQLTAIEKWKQELPPNSDRRIEGQLFKDCFHGWLELPSSVIKEETRTRAFDEGIDFLKDIHRKHGWE